MPKASEIQRIINHFEIEIDGHYGAIQALKVLMQSPGFCTHIGKDQADGKITDLENMMSKLSNLLIDAKRIRLTIGQEPIA